MKYVLGLDLGTSSLGWAILELKQTKKDGWKPIRIERTGVRIFEAGVEGDVEQGRDSSRAAVRREARQPRRQNWRTQYRKKKLFNLLQSLELLPPSESDNSESRKVVFDKLDAELSAKHVEADNHAAHQQLPYLLRTKGLKQQLEPFELGRALYSLAQRRGFLSNRKAQADDSEDGVVKSGISDLQEKMGERTVAQFFVDEIDPKRDDDDYQKMRKRYTARSMFHDEFDRIRECQKESFGDRISEEQWNEIYNTIFFQRPLKSQRHRIGKCEIDGRSRCVETVDAFQQFRIWHAVQNLRIEDAYALGRPAELSLEEQEVLVDQLQSVGMLTWKKAQNLLGLDKVKFTIQEWSTKGLVGHKTNFEMIKVFGDEWLMKPVEERDEISREVLYFRRPAAMIRRGRDAWGLDKQQAELLPGTRLEEAHARHSESTLRKFVDGMKQGKAYSTIRKELTGKDESEPAEFLPPLSKAGLDITNPAVIRALAEVRKVVNELIREYGKPTQVRIEMARELKNSRDKRRKIHSNNEERRKKREKAVAGILESVPGLKYSRADIDKWLLAEECEWSCPYTGKRITPKTLLGANPQFDVEHVYPRQYLDNSFINKTLCDHEFNRNVKGNRTAYDACSGRDDWEEILNRVRRFDGPLAAAKLKRFQTPAADIGDDFTHRHLNDTRYNAVVAKRFLESLYGGTSDTEGQRVFAVTGGHTAELRWQWHLNSVLSGTEEKTRDDHRHHAVDAIVIALTDPSRVQTLQVAAEFAKTKESRRFYEAVKEPWPRFTDDVQKTIDAINVSHRITRTLAGPLHAESIYGKQHPRKDGTSEHRIRKPISKLSATEIKKDKIVDPAIRKIVLAKLNELGESNPAKAFAEPSNHPVMTNKDGKPVVPTVPIHKVRVIADKKPRSIGKGARQRHVASGKDSNFASMIYAVVDKNGNEIKWEHKVITRLEAHERLNRNRKQSGERILIPSPDDFSDDKTRIFKFALCKNDCVLMQGPGDASVVYRVQSLGQAEIQLCPTNVPGLRGKERSPWDRITSIDSLRKRDARPAVVSASGIVRAIKPA